jgi:hypothetical protein
LLDKYPEYVIKRYESGSVATNADCDAIYRLALDKVGKITARQDYKMGRDPSLRSTSQSTLYIPEHNQVPIASQENAKQVFTGMKGNPVHVVVDEGPVPTTHFS